ncbi:hypothetical protein AB0933_22775 [Streptomyces venezuelae]|uniref:hypothetical protein n=1 Tax=Streptomyces venezuelae TaxID=54571 RepID=UPI0034565AED
MSVPPATSRHHAPWPRALLTLLAVLLVALAPDAGLATPATPPPAALSTETGGSEIQHDLTETALRLRIPTRRANHIPTPHRPVTPASSTPPHATPTPPRLLLPHVPTPRSVVLRC